MIDSTPQGLAEQLSASAGIPTDLIKTMLLMLGSLALSPLFRLLHSPLARKIYSLVLGVLFVWYLQKQWTLYVLAVAVVPYLLIKLFNSHSFQITLVTSFAFLLFIHSYRYIFDYQGWKIDCSVTVMYLVTKVVYYGEHLASTKDTPDLLSYLSYCFFFPSVMIGPTFSFPLFVSFIAQQNNPPLKKAITDDLVKTIVFAVLTGLVLPIFHPYWIIENQYFVSLPAIVQYLSLVVIGFFYRLKFYMAWGFTQMAVNLSGLSWSKKNNEYDEVSCGSIKFETQINPKIKTIYWNTSIQVWLKDVIYEKLVQKTKSSSIATYTTFLISAFWHGVHLTYYIGFVQWAVIVQISKWAYKVTQNAPEIANSFFMRCLAFLTAASMIGYTGMFIVILTWDQAIQAYSNMWYIGNILMLVCLLVTMTVSPKIFKKRTPKQ